jgi:hypothetical protein
VEWETKGGRSAVEDAKEGNLGEVCGLACLRGKVGSHEDGVVEQMNWTSGLFCARSYGKYSRTVFEERDPWRRFP